MNKKNLIALIVLLVVVGIYLITSFTEPVEKSFFYFGQTGDKFHTITLSDTTQSITLVKNSGVWEMAEPVESPIKKRKIEDLINKLTQAKSSSLPIAVSENAKTTYNVTDSLGTLIQILDDEGNVIRKTLLGRSSNYNFSYARHPQSSEIYQLSENLSFSVKPDVVSWRENIILNIDTDNIMDFQVQTLERNYSFTYSDSLWKFVEEDFSQNVTDENPILKKILSKFKSLRAIDFIDMEYENYGEQLANPQLGIRINTSDSESKIITLIPYNDTNDLVQIGNQRSPLYLVQKNFALDLDFDLDQLNNLSK